MKYREPLILGFALAATSGAVSIVYGFQPENILLLEMMSTSINPRKLLFRYWYFSFGLLALIYWGWSHIHGEGYNKIEFG